MTAALPGVWAHALELSQEHGLAVFPLANGAKLPAIRKEDGGRGCLDATTHAEQVIAFAERFPYGNFGIAGGGWTRVHVIDFDKLDALAQFTERYGVRPPTPTVLTPKPGRHEYYRLPEGVTLPNSAGRLAIGVDTRGTGGYVVGPGSALSDGRGYREVLSFAAVPLAPLPESILAVLQAPKLSEARPLRLPPRDDSELTARVAAYVRTLPALADGEGRNQTAFRLAAFVLHDCRGSAADAETACAVWNARNVTSLDDDRIATIVANAAEYGGRSHAA